MKQKNILIVKNPQAPKLYGTIKIHEQDKPIRPVVSYIDVPFVKLSRKLNEVIQNYEYKSKYSVKNSMDLINQLKQKTIPTKGKLVSFDITNMFTKINPNHCSPLLKNFLQKKDIQVDIINEILNLFEICIQQNYFTYDNKFYSLDESLLMGSPISPLLANICIDYFDEKLFNSNESKN